MVRFWRLLAGRAAGRERPKAVILRGTHRAGLTGHGLAGPQRGLDANMPWTCRHDASGSRASSAWGKCRKQMPAALPGVVSRPRRE